MLKPVNLEAYSLEDAWFQAVYATLQHGDKFTIDEGSYAGQTRLELDYVTIHIKTPWVLPLLPQLNPALNLPNPVAEEYLNEYLPYLLTDVVKPNEQYTYGSRIFKAARSQVQTVIDRYKNGGHRNNQLVLQIAEPEDLWLDDPPCLRQMDTRIQNGALHFFVYFRSNDLWSGFPANLAAIETLKQHMAAELNIRNGQIIYSSKGLHLYDFCVELAEKVRGKTFEEFRSEAGLSESTK